MQSQQSPKRNCEATPRSLVPEAMRTAKHCLYNQPTSTTKLRDYTQVTRSGSYAYRKTLPLQSSPVHNETARLHPGQSFQKLCLPQNTASIIIPCPQRNCETTPRPIVPKAMRTAKHCLYNHPLSTTKLRDYTQANRSKSYAYRKTLPLQSSPVHNETARIHPGHPFQKLCVPQNTASTIIPCPQRNCKTTPRPIVPKAMRTNRRRKSKYQKRKPM
ncbi:hypothetical protein J6590_089423 [Homalodisca vitripennis]|nr:hypothetical protein J6590_089788 [Homalodisca vitripennis]KAG8309309.1 hypothetical protein J6590_089423 [Homalodisca vitripennis]